MRRRMSTILPCLAIWNETVDSAQLLAGEVSFEYSGIKSTGISRGLRSVNTGNDYSPIPIPSTLCWAHLFGEPSRGCAHSLLWYMYGSSILGLD